MKITTEIELKVPTVPNYIRTVDDKPIAICDLTNEQLEAIGNEWTKAMIRRAEFQRK